MSGYQSVPTDEQKSGSCLGTCCGVTVAVLAVVVWGVLPYVLGTKVGYGAFIQANTAMTHEYIFETPPLTPATLPDNLWWPGCSKAGFKCEIEGKCFSEKLIPAMSEFNKKHPFHKVSYKSRKDTEGKTYTLRGWLLPGDKTNLPKDAQAPRVVINHGFTSNSNKWYPTLAAYYMRSMGFDVLLNNIRGVGYSDNTTEPMITTWGYAYHYDLLGAWDYLKKDPDQHLGGSQPSSKVGIMGFSMGAFITINAFTLEKDVPAAWSDSPPAEASSVFFFGAEKNPAAPIFKIPGVSPLIWHWMTNKAGVDIDARSPLKDIPNGPDGKRPIQIVANLVDETVPGSDVKNVVKALKKYPDKYDVAEPIYTKSKCNSQHHIVTMLLEPDKYRRRLCDFWTAALGADKAMCALDKIPKFEVATSRLLSTEETLNQMSVTV